MIRASSVGILAVAALGFGATTAHASEPYLTDAGFVLNAPSSGTFSSGLGAPAVEWDPTIGTSGKFVMFFESQIVPSPKANCPTWWVIGRATSSDGFTWAIDSTPALEPNYGSGTSDCAVTQPDVVREPLTGQYHLFYASKSYKKVGAVYKLQPKGIGHATDADGVGTFTRDSDTLYSSTSSSVGQPSATLIDNTLYLTWTNVPNMEGMYNDLTTTDGWITEPAPLLTPNPAVGTWIEANVFNPSLLCQVNSTDLCNYGTFFQWFGGKDTAGNKAIGTATSSNFTDWFIAAEAPIDEDPLDANRAVPSAWAHHTAIQVDAGGATPDTLVYYSADNAGTGKKAIGLAYTSGTWIAPLSRACDTSVTPTSRLPGSGDDWGFGLGSMATDGTADALASEDGDTAEGCSTTGARPMAGWLGLVGLSGLVVLSARRRR